MKILAIDCSSVSVSVALLNDDFLMAEAFNNVKLTHSQTLMPMVEDLFFNAQAQMSDVDVIACTAGPGSFTGVRIGVAAVKGLADALSKPCFSVSSLEAAASPFQAFDGIVCPLMDARRDQVYAALFHKGEQILKDSAMSTDELASVLSQYSNETILLCGDGAVKGQAAFANKFKTVMASPQLQFVHASSVGLLALEKIRKGQDTVEASKLLPIYLRLPQAQRELNQKNKLK